MWGGGGSTEGKTEELCVRLIVIVLVRWRQTRKDQVPFSEGKK